MVRGECLDAIFVVRALLFVYPYSPGSILVALSTLILLLTEKPASAATSLPGAQYVPDVRERYFLGSDGRQWRVRETRMPAYECQGNNCLIFDGTDIVRRVCDYQREWFALSDSQLDTVCAASRPSLK